MDSNDKTPSASSNLQIVKTDMFKLRHKLVELVEELKMRKKCDADNEAKLQDLVTKNHILQRSLLSEQQRFQVKEESSERAMFDMKHQYEEKIRRLEIDQKQKSVKLECRDYIDEKMKEELQQLKITNYHQEKAIKELEAKLHSQESSNENMFTQMVAIEKKMSAVNEHYLMTQKSVTDLKEMVHKANGCNERLICENRHHNCLLKEKSEQIDRLKGDLLQANIKCMSKSAEEFQLDELKATIESLQLQITTMEEGKALLNEELSKQAAIAMQAMSSAQVSQDLVNKHLTNANRNRLAFEKSSKECDKLKSQCLQLSQEIASLGEQIKSVTREQVDTETRLEDKVHLLDQDLTNKRIQLETAEKANHDLEQDLTNKRILLETAEKANHDLEQVLTNKRIQLETAEKANHDLEQDLTNKRIQLETAEKANHDLEKLNAQLHDLNDALRQHLMEATVRLEVVKEDFSQQTKSSVLGNQITQTSWEHMTVESQTKLTFMNNEDSLISCHVQTDSPLNQTLACQTDKSAICFERRIPGVSRSMQTDPPMSFWTENAAAFGAVDDTSLTCHDSRHRMIQLKQNISEKPSLEHTLLVTDSNRDMTSSALDDLECEHIIETAVHEKSDMGQNGSSSAADPATKNVVWFSQPYSVAKLLQSTDKTSTAQYSGHNNISHGWSLETQLVTPSCSHSSKLREDFQGLSGEVKSLDQPIICLNNAKLDCPSQLGGPSQLDVPSQIGGPSQLGGLSQLDCPSQLCAPSQLDCPSQLCSPSQLDCPSQLGSPSQVDEQFERCINSKVSLNDCNKRRSRMLNLEPQLKKLRLAGDHQQFMSPMYLKPSVATTYSWDLPHKLSEQVIAAKSLMTPSLLAEVTVIAASRIKPIFSAVASRDESGHSNLPNVNLQLSSHSQNQPSTSPQLASYQNQPSTNPQLASYQNQPSTNPQLASYQNQPFSNTQLSSYKKLQTCHSNGAEKTLKHTLRSERKLKADNESSASHKLSKEGHHSLADDKTRSRRLRLQRSSGHKKNPIGSKLKKGNLVFVPNLAGSSNTEKKIEGPLRGILKGPIKNKQGPMRCVNFPEELEIHLKGLTQDSQDCAPVQSSLIASNRFQQNSNSVVTNTVHVIGDEIPTTKRPFQQSDLETNSQEVILLDSQT